MTIIRLHQIVPIHTANCELGKVYHYVRARVYNGDIWNEIFSNTIVCSDRLGDMLLTLVYLLQPYLVLSGYFAENAEKGWLN